MGEKQTKNLKAKDDKQKEPKEMADLREGLYDLDTIEHYLEGCISTEMQVDPALMLVFVKGINKKIDYFQEKYDFQVDSEDLFSPEELIDFVSMTSNKGI